MLQLVYLNFTQPRFDRNDYDNLMKMLRTQLENAKSNPDFQMQEKVIDVLYGHNPRRQVISTELLDEFSFEALPAIYKKLYPDGNSFRFTFVGNIDPETLKPLVEKYIGSIPASKKPMTFADDKAYPVKGEVTEDFSTPMQQPKVSVNYTFTGDMDYSLENKAALSFLTQALNSRYLVSIREEKGGTYGVQVYGSTDWIPRETYTMTIAFDTNAEMADEAVRNHPQGAAHDRRGGPADRGHRETPRVHAQELEEQPRRERPVDAVPAGQIRLGTRLPRRTGAGDPLAHQCRRAGAGQKDPRRRQHGESRHAPGSERR